MKKEYKKPFIAVEAFGLSQSIALNCGTSTSASGSYYPTLQDISSCGWYDSGEDFGEDPTTYWLSDAACDTLVPEDFDLEYACYHNPAGGVSVFGSA